MRTLDQLAMAVRALTVDVARAESIITTAEELRFQKHLSRSKLIDEAFRLVKVEIGKKNYLAPERLRAKVAWCNKAQLAFTTAVTFRQMCRAKDPRAWLARHHASHAKGEAKHRVERKTQLAYAHTFAGAFAIMVQALDQQTPATFMAFPSVEEEDVIALLNFLEEAVDG